MFEDIVSNAKELEVQRENMQIQREQNERDRRISLAQNNGGPLTTGFTPEMMDRLLVPSVRAEDLRNTDYNELLVALLHDMRRIPNISTEDRRRIFRNFADTSALAECGSTRAQVRKRIIDHMVDIALVSADGSNQMPGLSEIGAIISSRTASETRVKMDESEPPKRKKIFGII